ncbi:MAG: methionyl-tRNA formyltransferase [Bacteroidota bacterium]
MTNMRILFMGTPNFAVATLSKLVAHSYTVVGVVTAPDRPAGRGRKLRESEVKKYAKDKNIPVLQPTNLKSASFLDELRHLQADVQIVVAFRMLPREVWSMPRHGTFNLHASLLPQYRGAAPINWAIMNGETSTGVTTFFIDDKIDTGEIILQEETGILETDTAGTLHDRLMLLGADLVLKTVQHIERGRIERKPQPARHKLTSAPKLYKETCRINWQLPAHQIYNHIRGLSPYPTAWSMLINEEEKLSVKLYAVRFREEGHSLKKGSILFNKKEMLVAVNGGFIELLEMQFPGKRRMPVGEILNGLSLSKTARMA